MIYPSQPVDTAFKICIINASILYVYLYNRLWGTNKRENNNY